MRRLTATEAARRFADLLDDVEHSGETVLIERRGRAIAAISPAAAIPGAAVKKLLREHAADPDWRAELTELRSMLLPGERSWSD